MNYTITQSQANKILSMLANVTDELLAEAKKLESLYKIKLLSGDNNSIKAAFFEFALNELKNDKKNYLHNEYSLLKDKQKDYDKLTYQERLTASQEKVSNRINEIIEQYLFNEFNELRTFINDKQPMFGNASKQVEDFLINIIGIAAHGIDVTNLLQTKVSERKKYLDKYIYNRKSVKAERLALIDSLLHIKTFLNYLSSHGHGMPNNILLNMLHFQIDDKDIDISIQKLNNMLTQIEYEN